MAPSSPISYERRSSTSALRSKPPGSKGWKFAARRSRCPAGFELELTAQARRLQARADWAGNNQGCGPSTCSKRDLWRLGMAAEEDIPRQPQGLGSPARPDARRRRPLRIAAVTRRAVRRPAHRLTFAALEELDVPTTIPTLSTRTPYGGRLCLIFGQLPTTSITIPLGHGSDPTEPGGRLFWCSSSSLIDGGLLATRRRDSSFLPPLDRHRHAEVADSAGRRLGFPRRQIAAARTRDARTFGNRTFKRSAYGRISW